MRGEFTESKLADDAGAERADANDEASCDELPPDVNRSRGERILSVSNESEPVEAVLDNLDTLEAGEILKVASPTALIPLYDQLDELGWQYEAIRTDPDHWWICITAESGDGQCGERLRRPRR